MAQSNGTHIIQQMQSSPLPPLGTPPLLDTSPILQQSISNPSLQPIQTLSTSQTSIQSQLKKLEQKLSKKNQLIKYLERKCGHQIIQATKKLQQKIIRLESENQYLKKCRQQDKLTKVDENALILNPDPLIKSYYNTESCNNLLKQSFQDLHFRPQQKCQNIKSWKFLHLNTPEKENAKSKSKNKSSYNKNNKKSKSKGGPQNHEFYSVYRDELRKLSVEDLKDIVILQASELNRINSYNELIEGSVKSVKGSLHIDKKMLKSISRKKQLSGRNNNLKDSNENLNCSNTHKALKDNTQSLNLNISSNPQSPCQSKEKQQCQFVSPRLVSPLLHSPPLSSPLTKQVPPLAIPMTSSIKLLPTVSTASLIPSPSTSQCETQTQPQPVKSQQLHQIQCQTQEQIQSKLNSPIFSIHSQTLQSSKDLQQMELSVIEMKIQNQILRKEVERLMIENVGLKDQQLYVEEKVKQVYKECEDADLTEIAKISDQVGSQIVQIPFDVAQVLQNYKQVLEIFGIQVTSSSIRSKSPSTTSTLPQISSISQQNSSEYLPSSSCHPILPAPSSLLCHHSTLLQQITNIKLQITHMIKQFRKLQKQSVGKHIRLQEAEEHIKYQQNCLKNMEDFNVKISLSLQDANLRIMGLKVALLQTKICKQAEQEEQLKESSSSQINICRLNKAIEFSSQITAQSSSVKTDEIAQISTITSNINAQYISMECKQIRKELQKQKQQYNESKSYDKTSEIRV